MTSAMPPVNISLDPNAIDRFSQLFEQHGRAIYGHIRALVPNGTDADEVFQETNLTLWQKFDQYRPDTDFRAWACRIAYYKVLKLRDRQIRSAAVVQPAIPRLGQRGIDRHVRRSRRPDRGVEALPREARPARPRIAGPLSSGRRTAKDVARWVGRNVHYVYRAVRRIHDVLFDCIKMAISKDREP